MDNANAVNYRNNILILRLTQSSCIKVLDFYLHYVENFAVKPGLSCVAISSREILFYPYDNFNLSLKRGY